MEIKEAFVVDSGSVLKPVFLEVFPINEVSGIFIEFNKNTLINIIPEKEAGDNADGSINIWRRQKNGNYRQHGQLVLSETKKNFLGSILVLTLFNSFPKMLENTKIVAREIMIANFYNLFDLDPGLLEKIVLRLEERKTETGSSWKFMVGQ